MDKTQLVKGITLRKLIFFVFQSFVNEKCAVCPLSMKITMVTNQELGVVSGVAYYI